MQYVVTVYLVLCQEQAMTELKKKECFDGI